MVSMQKMADRLYKKAESRAIRAAGRFILGFLLATVKIGGMRPFGISYGLSSKKDGLIPCAGALLGSLISLSDGGVLYAAAIMICFSCRMVLRETAAGKSRLFAPLCIGLSLVVVKGAAVLPFASLRGWVLLVCEGIFTAALSCVFAADKKQDMLYTARTTALVLGTVMAFETVGTYAHFSPARSFAAGAVIYFSSLYGGTAGAGAGAVLGALMDIAASSPPRLAFVYALGGLLGGAKPHMPRLLKCVMFALGSLSAELWFSGGRGSGALIAECIMVSCTMYFVLGRVEGKSDTPAAPKAEQSSAELCPAAEAVELLGGMVLPAQKMRRAEGMTLALDRAADTVCSSCTMAKDCWSTNYRRTQELFEGMGRQLKTRGRLGEKDLPPPIADKCLKASQLCGEINRQASALRARASVKKQQEESCRLMKKQYDTVAMLLQDMDGTRLSRDEYLKEVHTKVLRIAHSYFRTGDCTVRVLPDRLAVDILLPSSWENEDIPAARDSLALALGCNIGQAMFENTQEGRMLRFFIPPRISARVDTASVGCEGAGICGDCVKHRAVEGGRQIVVLSDGMGTGEGARALSQAAADGIIRLAEAGASLPACAKALEPVLEAGFEHSGFATLDMAEVDMLSGRCTFVKYGAPPSYILRGGKVQKVWKQSLPAGLGGEGAVLSCTLQPGDRILMLTDGAHLPSSFDMTGEQLCREMTSGRAQDDMTAAVISVVEG